MRKCSLESLSRILARSSCRLWIHTPGWIIKITQLTTHPHTHDDVLDMLEVINVNPAVEELIITGFNVAGPLLMTSIQMLANNALLHNVTNFAHEAVRSPATEDLRVSPWVHQADVLHAISPISLKLGQFKGSTPKLKMTNWFVVWIFMVGDSPPN